jgi:hypothetical protein
MLCSEYPFYHGNYWLTDWPWTLPDRITSKYSTDTFIEQVQNSKLQYIMNIETRIANEPSRPPYYSDQVEWRTVSTFVQCGWLYLPGLLLRCSRYCTVNQIKLKLGAFLFIITTVGLSCMIEWCDTDRYPIRWSLSCDIQMRYSRGDITLVNVHPGSI